jgi:dimethylhistidine N-methyltransferase
MNIRSAVPQKTLQRFGEDVAEGLSRHPKQLPCKYFYDSKGCELFEKICELEEYYITRTELALLERVRHEISTLVGANVAVIEPGAGAGIKIQCLLEALDEPACYVPIDISRDYLESSEKIIQARFPDLDIFPIQADFTEPMSKSLNPGAERSLIFFPGSTIGNFDTGQAVELLRNLGKIVGKNGAIIVGVDLVKERSRLKSAYDDASGVTAAFNKNLLLRINRELGGTFLLDDFEHVIRFNEESSRIEMHLRSIRAHEVEVAGQVFRFARGETIHTENSYKYTEESFRAVAALADLRCLRTWVDEEGLISLHYLVAAEN